MPDRRPPSPRLTEKERTYRAWFAHAEERGLSLAELSIEKDVAVGTLSWWKSEIRRRDARRRGLEVKRKNRRSEEKIEFVPVELVTEDDAEPSRLETPWAFEVVLAGGATVRVPHAFEDRSLTRVVRAVAAAC